MELLHQYDIEKKCTYRGEQYSVRDNGSILRHSREDKPKRRNDEKWTFGLPCKYKGYMNFGGETVHRIVATAFLGSQPSEKHVVDHLDNNKRNNRPENLRWVTRLENLLLNPITLARVIAKYGSLDNLFDNPSNPENNPLDQKYDWMRTVSKEEAKNTKENLLKWASEGKILGGGALGEWVYGKKRQNGVQSTNFKSIETVGSTSLNSRSNNARFFPKESQGLGEHPLEESPYTQSLSENVLQVNWKTPSEFPNCPSPESMEDLEDYLKQLTKGAEFSKNKFGSTVCEEAEINPYTNELFVRTHSPGFKRYALTKVFKKDNKFIHEAVRTFFTEIGSMEHYTIAMGKEWTGEDSIDNYC